MIFDGRTAGAVGVLAGTVFWALLVVPLQFLAQLVPGVRGVYQIADAVSEQLSGDVFGIVWSGALIIWAGWLAWRGRRGRAEIAAVLGLAFLLTRVGQLSIAGGGFGMVLITATAIFLIGLLVARKLDRARIQGMIIIVGLALVISEREFFADPVNSVIGGSVTLFLGLVWQFLTSGGEANGDSPRWLGAAITTALGVLRGDVPAGAGAGNAGGSVAGGWYDGSRTVEEAAERP